MQAGRCTDKDYPSLFGLAKQHCAPSDWQRDGHLLLTTSTRGNLMNATVIANCARIRVVRNSRYMLEYTALAALLLLAFRSLQRAKQLPTARPWSDSDT